MALLLPDPCDEHCPQAFKEEARRILAAWDLLPPKQRKQIASDRGLRDTLLEFIGDFADWKRATDPSYLKVARDLVRAAHGDTPPLVVDPFSGGGSIPLEALRLLCETFASDLNPVSCLILKTMLENIPQGKDALAAELRETADKTVKEVRTALDDLYPKDPDGATPTMFLWSRTVQCEASGCGAEIPLMRSFWLCKKKARKFAVRPVVVRPSSSQEAPHEEPPHVDLEVFTPESENEVLSTGTVSDAKAVCLCCGTPLSPDRVREQLATQQGGADVIFDKQGRRIGGARLRAVQTTMPGRTPKCTYRPPTDQDYRSVWDAHQRVAAVVAEWEKSGRKGPCPVPDEPLPPIGTLGFRVQRYGMRQWGHLFTARQKMALVTFAQTASATPPREEVAIAQALAISRCTAFWTSLSRWRHESESAAAIFGIQALPIIWDFCETLPLSSGPGSFEAMVKQIAHTIDLWPETSISRPQLADAAESPLPDESADVWFTDPPYYDAIPYSDLSDFFLVWLKRILPGHSLLQDPFDPTNPLSPKTREAVQDETKKDNGGVKDREFFERKMEAVFREGRRILKEDGIGAVIFAHKETESWEALLTGMVRSGWTISGSWPIATERPGRLRAHNSAALATSIHLVCRPRPEDAPIGDWPDVLRKLSERVRAWMSRLQSEGIRGADLVFSCIGPALEIFSSHRAVETVEGRRVDLPKYLEKLWEVVGRAALNQVLEADGGGGGLEEDARLTALFLWALQDTDAPRDRGETGEDGDGEDPRTTKRLALPFDVVRRFAQPMGIDLNAWVGRIISKEGEVVRLLDLKERAEVLFGRDHANVGTGWLDDDPDTFRQMEILFESEPDPHSHQRDGRQRRGGRGAVSDDHAEVRTPNPTVLDRVHTAMLFQANGDSAKLRQLIRAEVARGPEFLQLANALSALYPNSHQEKRLLDAMLGTAVSSATQ